MNENDGTPAGSTTTCVGTTVRTDGAILPLPAYRSSCDAMRPVQESPNPKKTLSASFPCFFEVRLPSRSDYDCTALRGVKPYSAMNTFKYRFGSFDAPALSILLKTDDPARIDVSNSNQSTRFIPFDWHARAVSFPRSSEASGPKRRRLQLRVWTCHRHGHHPSPTATATMTRTRPIDST